MALLCKIALLSILTRIFTPFKSKVIFIYSFLGCLCVYYVIALVIKIRMCDPVPGYWDLSIDAQCLDQRAALVADSVISVVSDLIILILPLPMTWSLQMSRNKKLRVTGMLSAGGLATAFSIYRLVLVIKEGDSLDQTMVFTGVILSGYVCSLFPGPGENTNRAPLQKRRRWCRSHLRLSPHAQHPDVEATQGRLQLGTLLQAGLVRAAEQGQGRRQGYLLRRRLQTLPGTQRVRLRPEPSHLVRRRRLNRFRRPRRYPQNGGRVADGGGHARPLATTQWSSIKSVMHGVREDYTHFDLFFFYFNCLF